MNKKLKFIAANSLIMGAFYVAGAMGTVDFMNTKAYAEVSTNSSAEIGELETLEIQATSGKSIELCNEYNGVKMGIYEGKVFYSNLEGKEYGVKVLGKVKGEGYIAKVFESERKYATPHDLGENISIENGKTTLYIRTYTSEEALKRAVNNKDVTNCEKTYKVNINKSLTNGADDIYLDKITLDSGNIPINFNREIFSYNIFVEDSLEIITIQAKPEDVNYNVKVNGFNAKKDTDYKKDICLKNGKNEIRINVSDDDQKIRTYILNVFKGSNAKNIAVKDLSTMGTTQPVNSLVSNKINQWISSNGGWQYIDFDGKILKNTWRYDKDYNKTYYLNENGYMATNWVNVNNKWYYLGLDGSKKTGWQYIQEQWYYLDSNGVMQNGWIKDTNGKYYYFFSDGTMAKNVNINGYAIGVDGTY